MEIVEAVKSVASGNKYFSETVVQMLARDAGTVQEKSLHEILSDRELQIFLLLASAKTVTNIANELELSVKTVSTYRSRILEKMRLRNNAELMHYANENNLVPHPTHSTEINNLAGATIPNVELTRRS